ncbi:protein-disulfide reductase DsbD [Aliiglaciecola sp. CAU 1673]|uniref:protein-disulfide reductase DsbD n=1 Tax=Aliiglaciecola sp. CAU 1673 TaxID=3032595 RepID=UPI0023DB7192|nr:protein-disulfide reductase DsbD [Aliiglaciecola sp. CAU 1673]MDF2177891.1 protein-disulfide reductase DsbD [Aliiglaciecola sp. CAU 1673]
MKYIKALLFSLCVSLFAALPGFAQDLNQLFGDEPEFLPVDQAFVFDFKQDGNQLVLSWKIAEGYYLYKKQFKTALQGVELGEPEFPPAKQIEDEYFGVSDVFFDAVDIQYPIQWSEKDGVVKVRYQGCAEAGLCYPATTKVVYLNEVAGAKGNESAQANASSVSDIAHSDTEQEASLQFRLNQMLSDPQHSLLLILGLLFVLGIGLGFTPCVYPMYPILSAIVVGKGQNLTPLRGFNLSFAYVQGMALTYSLLGVLVALFGMQLQSALQHPYVLLVVILVFVLLALVMFGLWELQLPAKWQEKLNRLSNQQKRGNYWGVFVMGALSGLVASPCTTAPLTGVLLFIAQSGDLSLGFLALYVLAMGMGAPLIAYGTSGGALLPKAGAWMNIIKVTFGFLLLTAALFIVERMVENLYTNLAWAATLLALFTYYQIMNQESQTSFWKGVRSMLIFLGMLMSAMWGYGRVVAEFQSDTPVQASNSAHQVKFMRVKDLADFEQKLGEANAQGKSVMIDLYADWCVACKEFEKYTFPDPAVKQELSNTVLMQIDLTDNTPQSLEFQETFAILGLPTILFFDAAGNELASARVTGFMKADKFAQHLATLPL